MAEFLQSKLSKSYLQKASRWSMNYIPCTEPPWQFLPFPKQPASKISLLCVELAQHGEVLGLETSPVSRDAVLPYISQPACPRRPGTSRCHFVVHVLHRTPSNQLLPFHHALTKVTSHAIHPAFLRGSNAALRGPFRSDELLSLSPRRHPKLTLPLSIAPVREKKMTSRGQQTSAPYMTKTGLTLLKECCGFTCSIM